MEKLGISLNKENVSFGEFDAIKKMFFRDKKTDGIFFENDCLAQGLLMQLSLWEWKFRLMLK